MSDSFFYHPFFAVYLCVGSSFVYVQLRDCIMSSENMCLASIRVENFCCFSFTMKQIRKVVCLNDGEEKVVFRGFDLASLNRKKVVRLF